MILKELVHDRAQPHRIDGLVQQDVSLVLGVEQPFRCRIAADENSWNRCASYGIDLLDCLDPGFSVRKMIIRYYEIGQLLALAELDQCGLVGTGGNDGVSPFAEQAARSLQHNWSIVDDKNDLAFDRKGSG